MFLVRPSGTLIKLFNAAFIDLTWVKLIGAKSPPFALLIYDARLL